MEQNNKPEKPWYKKTWGIILIVIFAFWLIGAIFHDDKTDTQLLDNSTGEKNEKIQTPEEFKEQLKRELSSFDKPFNSEGYGGTVSSVQVEVALFAIWQQIIDKAQSGDDEENKQLGSSLKKKVVSLQLKEFPKMRMKYAQAIKEILWEHDVYVTIQGSKNEILNLTGAYFAANKNIKEIQTSINEVVNIFRFKQVTYRWYKGADEYTFYTLETPSDNSLVEL